MATLALASAGAAIGGAFGYASIGWAVGSMLGNYLFAPDAPDTQGPRLNDLKVQSAAFGSPRPRTWGAMRQAGQIVDSTKIQETKHEEDVGGKGGGGGTQTTYTYSITMAVAFGEGPITGIRNIWANGNLIWSKSDEASSATIEASVSGVQVYLGDETQDPDPDLEAIHGAGNVPAYRGTPYVVFDGLQLEDFGNSPPHIEAEIVANGTVSEEALKYDFDPAMLDLRGVFFRPGGNKMFAMGQIDGVGDGYILQFSTVNYGVSTIVFEAKSLIDYCSEIEPEAMTWDDDGASMWALSFKTGTNVHTVCRYSISDPWEINGISHIQDLSFSLPGFDKASGLMWAGGYLFATDDNSSNIHKITTSGAPVESYDYSVDTADSLSNLWFSEDGSRMYAQGRNADGERRIHQYTMTSDFSFSGMVYEGVSPVVITGESVVNIQVTPTGDQILISYKPSYGYIERWDFDEPWDITTIKKADRLSSDGDILGDIIGDVFESAGLSSSDYDVSALTEVVPGFSRTRPMTARRAIEPLQQAYHFDIIESDWKLKAVSRGGSSVLSVAEDDLAAHEAGSETPSAFSVTRIQELELPREVRIKYFDSDTAYQEGSQRSQRIVTDSEAIVDLDLPMSLSASKARQIVEVLHHNIWQERQKVKVQLSPEHEYLDPADVITVTEDGNTHVIRINTIVNSSVLELEAVSEESSVYTSDATGFTGDVVSDEITIKGPTNLALLDIPILRDQDDDAGFYAAASGYFSGWSGAVLYKSSDGESYSSVLNILNESVIGRATDVLSDGPTTIIDESSTVNVYIPYGQLSSITDTELFNGDGNSAAIGADDRWEIIRFRDATLEADGSYTLSHLVRGVRGTEWATDTHAVSDRFVLLQPSALRRVPSNTDAIGSERDYKAVTLGSPLVAADAKSFTGDAVGLTPYAPAHLEATDNGDGTFDVSWIRRTRVGGEWRDYVDVPLGEASESYRVKVFSGGTEQSSTDVSSESATVTASAGDTIKVAQVSETVGAGYYSEITV